MEDFIVVLGALAIAVGWGYGIYWIANEVADFLLGGGKK